MGNDGYWSVRTVHVNGSWTDNTDIDSEIGVFLDDMRSDPARHAAIVVWHDHAAAKRCACPGAQIGGRL